MPGFQHSCFISYRHGQSEIKRRFIEEFCVALSGELDMLRDEKLFVDKERLKGGDFYNDSLARALYESATLVLIYQPNYFDPAHTYCAREYRAMCTLERERLGQFANAQDRDHGLIIPVVLRGEGNLPAELKGHRHYEDFSKFMLMDVELSRHPNYAPRIRDIANYISGRCHCLATAGVLFDGADMFRLPDEEEEVYEPV